MRKQLHLKKLASKKKKKEKKEKKEAFFKLHVRTGEDLRPGFLTLTL